MSVEVIIPWSGSEPHRMENLNYVRRRFNSLNLDVYIGVMSEAEPWCKARAVAYAVETSQADVIVVHDADVVCDGLDAAIDAVTEGKAAWAVPHGNVIRLNEYTTEEVLSGAKLPTGDPRPGTFEPPIYWGHAGGGIVVVRHDVYLDCPLDPRFVGWGQEDDSWALALTCLHGRPWRGDAPLWHLWHPPAPRKNRSTGSTESHRLNHRYRLAMDDPEAMRRLIEEARVASAT